MDQITGIATGSAATAPLTSAAGAAPGDRAALSADFETFLRMLTTQMQNQDPLNPVESADFAVQLATFSSVEQQVQTNDLLSGLGSQMATLGMGQLSGWIGLEAEARAPVRFAGDPVTLGVTVDPAADAAQLVVTDSQGDVVQQADIPAQSGPVVWTGRDARGVPLPDGSYGISVHSLAGGETVARNDATLRGRIGEARLEGEDVRLVFESGQSVRPADVVGLSPAED